MIDVSVSVVIRYGFKSMKIIRNCRARPSMNAKSVEIFVLAVRAP